MNWTLIKFQMKIVLHKVNFYTKIILLSSNIQFLLLLQKNGKVQISRGFAPQVCCSNHNNQSETCKPMQSTGSSEKFKPVSCKNVVLLKIRNSYISLSHCFPVSLSQISHGNDHTCDRPKLFSISFFAYGLQLQVEILIILPIFTFLLQVIKCCQARTSFSE